MVEIGHDRGKFGETTTFSPPGRYVGTEEQEDDGVPLEQKMAELTAKLYKQFEESCRLEAEIKENLEVLGYEA